jgi:2-amino-4-hydroxy-6-hydroxymethyldihydropteridine diphosphokinase
LSNKQNIEFGDDVVVALGSNLSGHYGSSQALLNSALARLPEVGLRVIKSSRWWRSAAWPNTADPDYLNGVALVETRLTPREVLACLLRVEAEFGRVRGPANAPRTLDLDLVAHGRLLCDEEGLSLPHPRAHLRRFVMGPLAEIAPGWLHPRLHLTAAELAEQATIGVDAAPRAALQN